MPSFCSSGRGLSVGGERERSFGSFEGFGLVLCLWLWLLERVDTGTRTHTRALTHTHTIRKPRCTEFEPASLRGKLLLLGLIMRQRTPVSTWARGTVWRATVL